MAAPVGRHVHAVSAACPESCCSDFINLPDSRSESDWKFSLTNPILPIFAQEKIYIAQKKGDIPVASRAVYDKLQPAFRLASRMLSDDRAVHYICMMHDGTLHRGLNGESPAITWTEIDAAERSKWRCRTPPLPELHLTRRPPKEPPSAKHQRMRSNTVLGNLAHILTAITFAREGMDRIVGMVNPIRPIDFRHDEAARQHFPRASETVEIMLNASISGCDEDEPSPWCQWFLATTIVHEVAHVLNRAIHGTRDHEVYYQDSSTSEAGFELQNTLFGGSWEEDDLRYLFPDRFSDRKPVVLMEDWPSSLKSLLYGELGNSFLRRVPLRRYCGISRIPYEFVAATCSDSFWESRQRHPNSERDLNQNVIAPEGDKRVWVMELVSETDLRRCEPSNDRLPDQIHTTLCEPSDDRLPNQAHTILCEPSDNRLPDHIHARLKEIHRVKERRLASAGSLKAVDTGLQDMKIESSKDGYAAPAEDISAWCRQK